VWYPFIAHIMIACEKQWPFCFQVEAYIGVLEAISTEHTFDDQQEWIMILWRQVTQNDELPVILNSQLDKKNKNNSQTIPLYSTILPDQLPLELYIFLQSTSILHMIFGDMNTIVPI